MGTNQDKIIYSICIEDVQNVAEQELDRELSKDELKIVEEKIGEYFNWYDTISAVIQFEIIDKSQNDDDGFQ